MQVIKLALENAQAAEAWNEKLAHLSSSIYATPSFMNFLIDVSGGKGHWLIAIESGKIAGSLPYLTRTIENIGTVINSLPWYGSHGSCNVCVDPELSQRARKALLTEFAGICAAEDVISSTVILSHEEQIYSEEYEKILLPAAFDERIGQITTLPANNSDKAENLMGVFRQRSRRFVRKGLKEGFTEEVTDSDWAWDFLYKTHVANMDKISGKPKPWTHFQAIQRNIPEEMRRLSVAMDKGVPVAALLIFQYKKMVEYITPVIREEVRSRQPLSYLIYMAMLKSIESGRSIWNWGGTWKNQHSLHHFKSGFGAIDHTYNYLTVTTEDKRDLIKSRFDELLKEFEYFYLFPLKDL